METYSQFSVTDHDPGQDRNGSYKKAFTLVCVDTILKVVDIVRYRGNGWQYQNQMSLNELNQENEGQAFKSKAG